MGVEEFSECLFVTTVGGCRHAEDIGLREMLKNPLITVREAMVRLIHDNVLKIILGEHGEPFLLAKVLHRAYRHGKETSEAVTVSLLEGGIQSRDHLQLVGGLG